MNILNSYLKFLNEQSGYLNFQEDRYNIMNALKQRMISCTRGGIMGIPQRIQLMTCQIQAYNMALQNIGSVREKCQTTPNADKCNQMYDVMESQLTEKLKYYNYELSNLQRKGGVAQQQIQY